MVNKLEVLEEEYNDLMDRIRAQNLRIEQLRQVKKVKEYIQLMEKTDQNQKELVKLKEELQIQKMLNCEHLFVIGTKDKSFDGNRTERIETHYCVKCGLDTFNAIYNLSSASLSKSQYAMWDIYLQTKKNGTLVNKVCEPAIAKAIYDDLKDMMQGVSEDSLIKYFEVALEDQEKIRKIKKLYSPKP